MNTGSIHKTLGYNKSQQSSLLFSSFWIPDLPLDLKLLTRLCSPSPKAHNLSS